MDVRRFVQVVAHEVNPVRPLLRTVGIRFPLTGHAVEIRLHAERLLSSTRLPNASFVHLLNRLLCFTGFGTRYVKLTLGTHRPFKQWNGLRISANGVHSLSTCSVCSPSIGDDVTRVGRPSTRTGQPGILNGRCSGWIIVYQRPK